MIQKGASRDLSLLLVLGAGRSAASGANDYRSIISAAAW
jgi:hypothetical protein